MHLRSLAQHEIARSVDPNYSPGSNTALENSTVNGTERRDATIITGLHSGTRNAKATAIRWPNTLYGEPARSEKTGAGTFGLSCDPGLPLDENT